MKLKRIVLALFILFFGALTVFFAVDLYHYSQDKSPNRTLFVPRLELSLIRVNSLTAEKTDISGTILVHNPLPLNLAADSLSYRFYINGVEVIKSTYIKSIHIHRWDSTLFTLPVTINNDKLINTLQTAHAQGADSVTYRVKTTFYTHLPFKKSIDIDVETQQPIFYIPTVRVVDVNYDSLSIKGVTLYVDLMVGNKNKIDFKFKDLQYRFALGDNPFVTGTKWGVVNIKQQDSTELVLPIRISFGDAFKGLGALISHGGKTGYQFDMELKLVADTKALNNSKVYMVDAGTVREIMKLAKAEKKKAKLAKAYKDKL